MGAWKLQDAKARLSELIETAKRDGPQTITQRGVESVVVVPMDEWKALKPKKDLIDVLLSGPRFEFDLPPRSKVRLRKPVKF